MQPYDGVELAINGRFVSQKETGVQRMQHEFLRALDRLIEDGALPSLRARMIAPTAISSRDLGLSRIEVEHAPGGAGQMWEQLTLPRHVRGALLLCLGNSAPILSMLRSRRVGVMIHDQAYRLFPRDYSLAYRLSHRIIEHVAMARARCLFTVSETERKTLVDRHPRLANLIVAPNGSWSGDDPAVPLRPDTAGRVQGLYVGSLTSRKNAEAIFRTAVRLASERGHSFYFVGAADARSIALADRVPSHLRSLIRFSGYVDMSSLPGIYADSTYLLYPTFYEASGLPPTEAMTFGCPVITSDLPVMRERCGTAALYCDPADQQSIFDTVVRLTESHALQRDLADRGRARARLFSWSGQAARIISAMIEGANF